MRNYRFGENPRKATEIKKNGTEFFGIDQDGETKAIPAETLLTKANVGLGNVDNTADTEKPVSTPQQQALDALIATLPADLDYSDLDPVAWHKNNFRGKMFENGLTQAHWDSIADGTFTDLYIGDQIKGASGTWYYIADINYYINTGGNVDCRTNHLVLVPVGVIGGSKQMNASDTTSTGYYGSKMFSYSDGNIKESHDVIMSDFGSHMLEVERYLSTNNTTGAGWYMRYDDLMNETMVYGAPVNGRNGAPTYGAYNIGVEKSQLALFRLRHDLIGIRSAYWLRDIAATTHFASVNSNGNALLHIATNTLGVRSAFCVKA